MTTVGKILVFFNLVFSLIVVALLGLDYGARTHWSDAYTKLAAKYQVADTSSAAYKGENDKLMKERQDLNEKLARLAGKAAEIKGPGDVEQASKMVFKALTDAQEQAKFQRAEVERLSNELKRERVRTTNLDTVTNASQKEVERRQADVEKMRETLKAETDRNIELVKSNNELRDRAVGAEIQAKSFREMNSRLEVQLQEMARDLARVKANVGTTARGGSSGKNPPPERVEGLIERTDPRSGLVTITLGSDAGLSRGNTMEVFRLGATPKYLGTIRIVEVDAKSAVGQPTGRLLGQIQRGDRVASRILPQ